MVTVEDTLWPGAPAILLAEQGEDSAFACVPRQPPAPSAVGARSDVRTVTFDIARGANNTPQPGQSSPRRRSPIASKGRPAHLYRERGAR
ncbi:MAG: hypothetical protein FJY92_03760 [Candidatus Hydrogenedentes bacterium]|nr:hypothetical protein [Candidatus Hydrogenedentota bacterium]